MILTLDTDEDVLAVLDFEPAEPCTLPASEDCDNEAVWRVINPCGCSLACSCEEHRVLFRETVKRRLVVCARCSEPFVASEILFIPLGGRDDA